MNGKTLKGSQRSVEEGYKEFVQIASVYSTSQGIVVGMSEWLSRENSEILVVQNLIKTLGLEGVVFTLDALHCQKKPLRLLSTVKTTTSSRSKRTKKSSMRC